MIYTAVARILHGKQPLQLVHHLVKNVRRGVAILRNGDLLFLEERLVELIDREQLSYGESRTDNIFIIVAGIIPSAR